MIPPAILAAAETLNLCLPPPPDQVRLVTPRFAAFKGDQKDRYHNLVQRFRLAPEEVEAAVAELRAFFRAHDRHEITYEVGSSSTPSDLLDRLAALGMIPDDEPEVAGMVLRRSLPETPTEVEVVPVTDFAGFFAQMTIFRRCFGRGAPDPTEEEAAREHERRRGKEDHLRRWLAYADGKPVAAAEGLLVDGAVVLGGGATLPEARGKGAYRALVAARWRAAVERGTPVLVVQAGKMSRPILERLGFETVATIRVMVDRLE
jgi:GNAT superfamily N-acetyltransferase